MSAWDILIANSTLPADAIAWDHLNNQAGGTGSGETIITGGFLTANIESILTADIEGDELIMDTIYQELSMDLESQLTANLEDELSADIVCNP